jgi:hypothetical protein
VSDQEKITILIAQMRQMFEKPGAKLLTSPEMGNREERRFSMATTLELNGQRVRPEYTKVSHGRDY